MIYLVEIADVGAPRTEDPKFLINRVITFEVTQTILFCVI